MIPLTAHRLDLANLQMLEKITQLVDQDYCPAPLRGNLAKIVRGADFEPGYRFYISFDNEISQKLKSENVQFLGLDKQYEYLSDKDIIRLSPKTNSLRVLYRKKSKTNYFLLTERCNHYCLMCSQPPKDVDDSFLAQEILETIPLIDINSADLGFSGGEPTLLGDTFFKLIANCESYLPRTRLHILSNGRKFADLSFAKAYANIGHHDVTVGIPIYSDISSIHNYVVQADNAFDETIKGILNLKSLRQKVEIRVVVHKQTYERLPQLATFISRNLAFVDHVALMGLEITGFTRANMSSLWIDPIEYRAEIEEATKILALNKMNVSIYNHQLCTIPQSIWPYARKSISDWKNEYLPECTTCTQRENCGGFFTSQLTSPSNAIKAFS